ncbi:MAG: hypothetical protein NXI24_08465 [bacterium]|nr:hypothetical protein [bacterium]
MKLWSVIRPRLDRVLTSYRFRHGLFSLFFGLCVVAIYYFINWLVPSDYLMRNQLVTILFIIVAVLVLFPARAWGLQRVMQRNEYTAFFGRDFHHLDVVARQFSVETLVNEVFPEFLQWLGVRQGRLAILNPDRTHFDHFVYRNRQLHRGRPASEHSHDEIALGIKNYQRSLHVHEFGLPPALRNQLAEIGAVMVRPFHYRQRLLGFLVLNEEPRNRHAERALDFFSNKAAVSIQNHILTNRIIDSRLYDQELVAAQKIKSTLHDTPLPAIPGFELLRRDHQNSILEFFPARGGERWFLVGLTLDRLTSPGGIILYSMLGYLYSFLTRETQFSMHRILGQLRKHRDQLESAYPLSIFVAELISHDHSVIFLADGRDYDLRRAPVRSRSAQTLAAPVSESANLISSGSRKFLDINEDHGLVLSHGDTRLLEIHYAYVPPSEFSQRDAHKEKNDSPGDSSKDEDLA